MIRRKTGLLLLVLAMFLNANQSIARMNDDLGVPVEVVEVREMGLSDSDETKSVIEVKWSLNPTLQPNHSVFNVTLEVIYADGAILIFDEQAKNTARSAQIEVPTLHIFRGRKAAIIKQIKAFVTAEILE